MLKSKLSQYSHVIWDWNGTLLDDLDLTLESVSGQLLKNNLKIPSRDEHRQNFCFPIIEYYQKLGFDLKRNCFKDLSDDFYKNYFTNIADANLFDGIIEVLNYLRSLNITQSILSAASDEHLKEVVLLKGIDHYFKNIMGIDNQYADSKIEIGRVLIQNSSIPNHKTVLVGDTDHDFEVAEELGINVLLIADGHQSYERLVQLSANVMESRYV